ncbi:hypothetical protein I5M27_06775 [Adhaeribacter sp. BT258]|uniref:KAP NTPase domain-containing protein n=1 Tax=Adhaeribacter terrigena TaxID=2793070 RepID=A0ABS1C0I8_9BACT|nr:P-loop NTPase fold protein [Adhaeribacter terrigena]MBK0402682.1 hypothetical protein [Adhaeribacter terrigena]
MSTIHSHLDEAVKRYLVSETNYALLITGNWGSGKTYYYNNNLLEIISTTDIFGNEDKKYIPIKVSLFGKKNISEITEDIYTQLYPLLESNVAKKGGKLLMNAAIGYIKNKTEVDLKDYLPEDFITLRKKIQYQQIVICFDDLERVSKEFKYEEIIGYINSLVENDSTKVIIIANENIINKKKYNIIKEKTIGLTVEFTQTINDVFDSIVYERYAAFNIPFHNYLIEEKEFIINLLKNADENLRNIIFTLDILSNVYDKCFKVNYQITRDQFSSILLFVISTSIEFRKRVITKDDKEQLSIKSSFSLGELNWLNSPNGGTKPVEKKEGRTSEIKEVLNLIKDKYYKPSFNYIFFPHIFDFITLSIFLNENLLKEDLEKSFPKEEELPDYYKIYLSLEDKNLGLLNSKEYRSKTSELIKFASQGKFKIFEIFNIFNFALRFNNPLKFKVDKLVESLIKGMRLNKENEYSDVLQYEFNFHPDNPNFIHLNKLATTAIEINESLYKEENDRKAKQVIKLMYSDLPKFGTEIGNSNFANYYLPIFNNVSAKKFFKLIKECNYDSLKIILNIFKGRYRNISEIQRYKSEKDFFITLHTLLQKFIEKNGQNSPSKFMINRILIEVTQICNTL